MSDQAPAFRIYYADGSTYDGAPELAPGTGVLVIVQRCPDRGRSIFSGEPIYCWHGDDGWFMHDTLGWHLCAVEPGWKKIVAGEMVRTDAYRDAYNRAYSDPDFPKKQFTSSPEKKAP